MEKDEKRILVIDSSILNTLQKCGYQTFLSYVKHLRALKTPEPFERGDLVHVILERYYKELKEGKSIKEAEALGEETGRLKYPTLNLETAACEWILNSFHQYVDRWETDGIKVIDVEKAFLMKVYEDDDLIAYYAGKIDLIAEFPLIGQIPVDHKSRTRRNEETILNNQFIGYAINCDANFVYVNEFGLQTTLKPEEKFRRIPLSYPDDLKAHWINNIIRYWVRQLDYYMQENVWPEQWNPFVCRNCIFSQVCKSGSIDEKTRKLSLEYQESEPWDVTKVLEGNTSESE